MRQIWTWTISFWLIHIPIKLYNATQEDRLSFDYLRKNDLCQIKYAKVCKDTWEEVPFWDIVKWYEYEKWDYVVLTDEDFIKASPEKTQTIEILEFIEDKQVNDIYLEKPYYLEPTKWAQKAYVLLREALKKAKKVWLAKFVLKTREHIWIIKPDGNLLILDQMRYASEIRSTKELNIPDKAAFNPKELEMALQFIEELTVNFKPEDFKDTYTEDLLKLIDEKRQWKTRKVRIEPKIPTEVPDIMTQLKKSLEMAKKNKA
ncbi:MAG: hypothetical protein ACD_2C00010G0005 [uncultured bacterium (gcode 4)]|uniref:Non-homologous end joining protein Ku n=1 Tax=uncultured bacterium (gcode 4) TaxID=1234023 RepID=K2G7F8_9BACT|nr:MAG: hypothetical protein ACD_2C00010G0005 [uncultured bacterium (gcode 4)]